MWENEFSFEIFIFLSHIVADESGEGSKYK